MKTYEIEGIVFLVDTDNLILREKNNRDNIIRQEIMVDRGTHYEFFFQNANDAIVKVKMPQFVHLDPEGMRSRYSLPAETPLPKNDAGFKCDIELFHRRMAGELPVVVLNGWRYIVDGDAQELRPEKATAHRKAVSFKDLLQTECGYRIALDSKTGAIIPEEEAMPENRLVVVEVPDIEVMDPVGAAHRYGFHSSFFVDTFPVRYNIKARVITEPPSEKTKKQNKHFSKKGNRPYKRR